jgi:hypothetical protein
LSKFAAQADANIAVPSCTASVLADRPSSVMQLVAKPRFVPNNGKIRPVAIEYRRRDETPKISL